MSDFLLADGFGNLSDGNHTAGVTRELLGEQWSAFANDFNLLDIGDGRKWMRVTGAAQVAFDIDATGWAAVSTVSFCFRIRPTDRVACAVVCPRSGANNIGTIGINTSGQVVYTTNFEGHTSNNLVLASSALPLNTISHVELKVFFDNAAGTVAIYINGALDASIAGVDTISVVGNANCDSAQYFHPNYGCPADWRFTDFVVHVAGTPAGDAGVYYRESNAAGVDSDFTPSAGANHENVDEIGPDEDVTYNESDGTSGHRDSFQGDAITDVTVLSVCSVVRSRKTGAGAAQLMAGVLSNGSEDQSAGKGLSTDYLTLVHFVDDDPDTAAAWLAAAVSAAEATMEVV